MIKYLPSAFVTMNGLKLRQINSSKLSDLYLEKKITYKVNLRSKKLFLLILTVIYL